MKLSENIRKIMTQKVGNPKIFVCLIIWLMILVFFGTLAQREQGLYLVQLDYFSSWIKWFGFIPTPSAKLTMLIMFISLSGFFFRPNIWNINKIVFPKSMIVKKRVPAEAPKIGKFHLRG